MTLTQIEGLGDELFPGTDKENIAISEELFNKIKTLNDDEKKYLKLYINTKFSSERTGCALIFRKINKALDKIFKELRDIKKRAFAE